MTRDIDIRQMQQRLAGAFPRQTGAQAADGGSSWTKARQTLHVLVDRENDRFRFE